MNNIFSYFTVSFPFSSHDGFDCYLQSFFRRLPLDGDTVVIIRRRITLVRAPVGAHTREVIKTGMTQHLTDHINRVDDTNIIKCTYEEEAEGTIPFLDILLMRKESGEVKLLIFRKNIHTDQYIHFSLHHPTHQNMGVIRTLLERCETLVTEEEDKRK